jgi:hypothetical protein
VDRYRFRDALIGLFPGFREHWDDEDVHREADGSFTAHGLASSFFFFFRGNYRYLEGTSIERLAQLLEEVVSADPDDRSDVANAICTSFLELLDENREGRILEPHLGEGCSRFLAAMRGR